MAVQPLQGLWMKRRALGARRRSGRSRQRMQMSKFSLSSHPCGMQDESCPNGAHSCCSGALRRCAPGHPGRENHTQPRLLLPWQRVHRWKKGRQRLGKGGQPDPEPLPFPQGLGMLQGGGGAAKAVAGMELVVGRLRRWVVSLDLAGRQCWKTSLTILYICLDFSLVPNQKGILLLQEAEVGSVKQDFNMNTHSLESRGLLPGCIPCCGDLWLQKSLGWSLRSVYGYRSHF